MPGRVVSSRGPRPWSALGDGNSSLGEAQLVGAGVREREFPQPGEAPERRVTSWAGPGSGAALARGAWPMGTAGRGRGRDAVAGAAVAGAGVDAALS